MYIFNFNCKMFSLYRIMKRLLLWMKYSYHVDHENMNIPSSLGCNTLEDVVIIVLGGFSDMRSSQVEDAIIYLKKYLNDNYYSIFKGEAMISIPHKTDPWYPLNNMARGVYIVGGRLNGNYCHSRWLLRVINDNITYVEQYEVGLDLPSHRVTRQSYISV